jgi:5'-nucleotidase
MGSTDELVLGVDLDGVCADYEGAFRASVARQLDRDPGSMPPQSVMDAYSEWGLTFPQYEQAHRRAVLEDRIFRHMDPMPGVSEALWRLSDRGVWIRIITHRLLFNWAHETSAADTAAWLDAHRIPYRDLCFIGDKPNVGADLYVDDSPSHVVSLRAAGKAAIVFDQPYNRHLPGPRATSWDDVVGFVEEVLSARARQVPLPLGLSLGDHGSPDDADAAAEDGAGASPDDGAGAAAASGTCAGVDAAAGAEVEEDDRPH